MVKAPWLLEGHWYRGRWLPQTTAASRLTRLDKLSMTGRREGEADRSPLIARGCKMA
jgi:hypothetical protein